jgi:hypothetical protein
LNFWLPFIFKYLDSEFLNRKNLTIKLLLPGGAC